MKIFSLLAGRHLMRWNLEFNSQAWLAKVMLLVLLLVAAAPMLRADHPDAAHRPAGRAEHMLSGVYINSKEHNSLLNAHDILIEPIKNVIGDMGKPLEVHKIDKCESDLLWKKEGIRLEVGSGCIFQTVGDKYVSRTHGAYSVEVWGTHPHGAIGVTGHGLALGDSISKMKRLYGRRCECGRYVSGTGTQNTHGLHYAYYARYIWGDSVELDIDTDAGGRVVHMLLIGDLE